MLRKFGSLNHQATFINVSLSASRPNAIVLMVNWRVQVKVFFISEKTFFDTATGRRRISFLQRSRRFCLTASEMMEHDEMQTDESHVSQFVELMIVEHSVPQKFF